MDLFNQKLSEYGWNEDFKNFLKNNHVHYKEDNNSDLVILFNNYNDLFTSKINTFARSLVISKNLKKIVSYSCPTPLENSNGINYMIRNCDKNKDNIITECYEGTFLSLFNYEDKWYLSTRKCLDANESKYKEKTYFEMFENILNISGYETFESFTNELDKNKSYYFILLDHENINLIDYSYLFGENYHKLIFVYSRNIDQKIETLKDYSNVPNFIGEHIIKPKIISDISYLDEYNKNNRWNIPAKSEGLVIRTNDGILIKLQSLDYQFAKSVGTDENLYLGMLKMYQLDKLEEYINYNGNKNKFERIKNPINENESYLTIGIINSIFRVLTSELLNLYGLLYNNKGLPIDNELYKIIPNEYKYFMFKIRGIHFRKINLSKDLSEKDIYFLLKNTEINNINSLLRMRKLMNNLSFKNKFNDQMKKFKQISLGINKLNMKLINIYTAKLFPELMDNEIPDNIVLEN